MEQLSEKLSRVISSTPFKNRPLALILAVLLCALFFIQMSLPVFIAYAVAVVLYSLKLAFFGGFHIRKNPLVYVLPIILIIATLLVAPNVYNYNKVVEMQGERTVKAVITHTYYEERFGALYLAELKEIDGETVDGKATLAFEYEVAFEEYDTVTVKGAVGDARKNLSGGELMLAKSNNMNAEIECTELLKVTNENKKGVSFSTYVLGDMIRERLYELLPQNTAGYASAILLGDKSGISSSFRADMSALGTSHILAVSGMHMSIIAVIVTFLAERLKASRKIKSVIIIVTAICFMVVAGFSASVIRAAIMLTVGMLAVFAHGRSDPITSLMLSGTIICAFSPETVLSCGFLLSFFATLGIVTCALYAERSARARLYSSRVGDMKTPYRIFRKILFSLIISLCATLFTAPVMSLYFSEISFVSAFTNLLAVPMAFVSMLLTLLCIAFGSVPLIGAVICSAFSFLYNGFEQAVKFAADSFTTTVSLRYPFFVPCLILLAAMLVFMLIMRVKNPIALIGAFVSVAVLFGGGVQIYSLLNADRVEIVYAAEPNSEGFIVSSGSKTIYIDVGNGSKKIPQYLVDIAKIEYYETELDGYMLTHYHTRHISTISKILIDTEIKTIYLPEPVTDKEMLVLDGIISVADTAKIVMYRRGEAVELGDVQIEALDYTLLERSEHPVIAMNLSAGGKSVAYVGASVTESLACVQAEEFIRGAGAVICGSHGPVVKEYDPFLSFSPDTKVYLSPYEETDENIVFPLGKYMLAKADGDGYARIKLRLNG